MSTSLPVPVAGSGPAAVRCRIGARAVSRSFGPVRANVDVSLDVAPGTVHAVVGENGAGKSTLMRILYGLDQPDSGTVVVDDEAVALSGPRAAIERGIGLVQQELAIIPELTLLENLVLGHEPGGRGRIDWAGAHQLARDLAARVGVEVDWGRRAAVTSIAVQQQVEILRLVHRGADVLILDEPTAVLAPAQAAELLRLLGTLREAGRTVVFISHKLDEVVDIADRMTVLRAGRTAAQLERGQVDRADLAALIVGDGELPTPSARTGQVGAEVLRVEGLRACDDRGASRLEGVDLTVRAGEVLGVAAVAGNGQDELAEAVVGVRRATAGSVHLDGTRIDGMSLRRRRAAGVAYVSADRKGEGLALGMSLVENAVAGPALREVSRWGFLRPSAVRERAAEVLGRAAVRFGSPRDPASSLSGGNQQRVVIGRETITRPRLIVASQPTRGVDVRGIAYIHELLRRARDEGAAVLLFSEELDEVRELSDRVVVLHRGAVAGELPAGASRSQIGELMLGGHPALEDGGAGREGALA